MTYSVRIALQTVVTIFCFVLVWTGAASAQGNYLVAVSQHAKTTNLTKMQVQKILSQASKLMQKIGHTGTAGHVACNVTFTLRGDIHKFETPGVPDVISTEEQRNAAHKVGRVGGAHFYVTVVNEIEYCNPSLPPPFLACAYPLELDGQLLRSIIVVHPDKLQKELKRFRKKEEKDKCDQKDNEHHRLDHILWSHEFGHLTGLPHRGGKKTDTTLMTACGMPNFSHFKTVEDDDLVEINREECLCLRSGPGSCLPIPPHEKCGDSRGH